MPYSGTQLSWKIRIISLQKQKLNTTALDLFHTKGGSQVVALLTFTSKTSRGFLEENKKEHSNFSENWL